MDERARVSLSIPDGRLEVEGSEAFVEKQLEELGDVIDALLERGARKPAQHPGPRSPSDSTLAASYPNVFALGDDGQIQITKQIPGSTTSEKMVDAALLLLLARGQAGGLPFDEIRAICKQHGCLDEKNFASTIKEEKNYFICSGSRKRQRASLTNPGRTKAMQLATALNAS